MTIEFTTTITSMEAYPIKEGIPLYVSSGTSYFGGNIGQGTSVSSAYAYRMSSTGSGATAQYGFFIDFYGDSSATSSIIGFRSKARSSAAVYTVSAACDFLADTIQAGSTSTINNAYGLYVADQTAGVSNYGITTLVSSGANKYNIYASGTASNYFAGGVNFDGTSDPGAGNIVVSGLHATGAVAPTIASASTIAPTKQITFISGTTTINTITAPSPISTNGGQITLIPTGLFSTGITGNIALLRQQLLIKH